MPPQLVDGLEKMVIDESNCAAYNRAIVDLLPGAFCVLDLNRTIQFVNEKAIQLLGQISPYGCLGKNILDFIAPESREQVDAGLKRTLLKRVGSFSECVLLRPDKTKVPIIAASSLVLEDSGDPLGFVCVAHNITNLSQTIAKETLAFNRALFYVDIMSHDISNQLQVILSATELLLSKLEHTDYEFLLNDIKSSVLRCNRIVKTSEIMEQIITSDTRERSLREAVHLAVIQIAETNDIDVESHLEIGDSLILADEFLEQLLFAILDNACIHNHRRNKMIWLHAYETDDGYSVVISDNGPGIPETIKCQLLDMQHRKGGLGLHLCRLISDKYGAKINISDRIEGSSEFGTSVEVWFPKLTAR